MIIFQSNCYQIKIKVVSKEHGKLKVSVLKVTSNSIKIIGLQSKSATWTLPGRTCDDISEGTVQILYLNILQQNIEYNFSLNFKVKTIIVTQIELNHSLIIQISPLHFQLV
ncbi:Hypothetical_protein [Hexamita inflata]|uniref:Hypothetical_protein n=1 Tax=Hexamita inflata TaxID=28002 RepID=A0AA86NVD4_9EUKA|nr:Hypothetical protein HINF_LOCUS13430 [Hexamita inflata]